MFASVIAVVIQLRLTLRAERARTRPYVVAFVYESVTAKGDPAVYLALENQGESAALDVTVAFRTSRAWHYIENPDFPFQRARGIPVVSPGTRVDYFLGVLNGRSPLRTTYAAEVDVAVTYRSTVVPHIPPDTYRLTLNNKFGRLSNVEPRRDT